MMTLVGCLQLDVRITVNEDGSATITERLRFTRQLMDLAGDRKPELMKLLSREVALERMKRMGNGVELVSHEVHDAEGASKEAVIVYKVPDLNKLVYVSPWFAYPDYADNNMVKFKMEPLYKSRAYVGGRAGEMCVTLEHVKPAVAEPKLPEGAAPPPGPTPLENQVYRDLAPLFRDMLKDVQVRLTFESYAPISSALPLRNRRARPRSIDLVNFTDKDMDQGGGAVLGNEEIMLDLARWRFSSPVLAGQVRDADTNQTLAAFTPLGSRYMWWLGGTALSFKPSRQLFDRHFAGKMLDFSEWAASPKEKHVLAKFEQIGFQKEERKPDQ
jgi:hypothetical protein